MNINDHIDRKDLNYRLDGDIDLFRELTTIFISDSEHLLNNIYEAISEKDPQKIRKSAHTIKGAISNFSATKAYDLAYVLEEIGRDNELDKATKAFAELKTEVAKAIEAMKLLVKEDSLF